MGRKNEVRVYTRDIDGHSVLHYAYHPTYDVTCVYNLVSEVGEPWQPEARKLADALAARREKKIVQIELDRAPWYVEALVSP